MRARHVRRTRLRQSRWFRLPQVTVPRESEEAALGLAKLGVVGAWFGAGSPDFHRVACCDRVVAFIGRGRPIGVDS